MHGPLADQSILDNWSSCPSDHAPLFFTFAGGFFLVNRLAGLVAFFHAAVIVSLVRVYLGLHYPGDILAGALIGILLSFTLVPLLARWSLLQRTVAAGLERYPYLLYPAIFFVTFQIATLFDPLRIFLSVVGSILEG